MRGASSRVPRLSLVPSFSRTRSGCGGCGAKNASHQFAAFGGGAVVVPGVRASAGKAVSSQSSLGTRIFSSPLVDCNWLRLRRCESLCFYAALMSLHDIKLGHRILRVVPITTALWEACMRAMLRVQERSMAFLRFSSAVAATAFQQLDHRRRIAGARRRRDERSQILLVDATQRCASNPSASRVCWCRRQTEQLRGAGLSLAGLSR